MLKLLGGLLIVWFVVSIYECVKAIRKKQLKYVLKTIVNGWRPLVHMIGASYIILFGISVLPVLEEWQKKQIALQTNEISVLLFSGVTIVWLIFMMLVYWYALHMGFNPWIKYTDAEKEIRKQAYDKRMAKMPSIIQHLLSYKRLKL